MYMYISIYTEICIYIYRDVYLHTYHMQQQPVYHVFPKTGTVWG